MFSGRIDDEIDILITHMPPLHHLDLNGLGDEFLLQEIWRVRPKLHVFGHAYAGYRQQLMRYDRLQRLYEQACAGAGYFRLFEINVAFVLLAFKSMDDFENQSTWMINASIVGGSRDGIRRKPHVLLLWTSRLALDESHWASVNSVTKTNW